MCKEFGYDCWHRNFNDPISYLLYKKMKDQTQPYNKNIMILHIRSILVSPHELEF